MTCRIFRRAWWRKENGKIVPNPGARKTTLTHVDTEKEARAYCEDYNSTAPKCWRSIKAEYTSC